MALPRLEVIQIDNSPNGDTQDTMVKKINQNFENMVDWVMHSFSRAGVDDLESREGQEVFQTSEEFLRNSHSLIVFVNGVVQVQGKDYVELSSSTVKFLDPLEKGDRVYMIYNKLNSASEGYLEEHSHRIADVVGLEERLAVLERRLDEIESGI